MKKGVLSFAAWCERGGKQLLLSLYDTEGNPLPPSEVSYSSRKQCKCRCPVCGTSWAQNPNHLIRIQKGSYNVFTKREEETFCPYCKGERVSPFYNLGAAVPEAVDWWDEERNDRPIWEHLPSTHKRFYLRCPECRYAFPKPVRLSDRRFKLLCPCHGKGRSRELTDFNCLEARFPLISKELDDEQNGGITGKTIPSSYKHKLWFHCPAGHSYHANVSNRTSLGCGCSVCQGRRKTSFPEQAIRFYLAKCAPDLQSGQEDPHTKRSVDILLPSQRTAIEYNSRYYHNKRRAGADAAKLYALAQYYRVFVIAEEGAPPPPDHPLIIHISVPVFQLTAKQCAEYGQFLYELIRKLFPLRDFYPNINIMRDQLLILQEYVHTRVEPNFKDTCPALAKNWHPELNGSLKPDMFPPNSPHLFHWLCGSCGKSYQESISNRRKTERNICTNCCRKLRYKRPLLAEAYPALEALWSTALNAESWETRPSASEKIAIFELPGKRLAPARVCCLSDWLDAHPDRSAEEYLTRQLEKYQKTSRPAPEPAAPGRLETS